jgi:hypothetical protein
MTSFSRRTVRVIDRSHSGAVATRLAARLAESDESLTLLAAHSSVLVVRDPRRA